METLELKKTDNDDSPFYLNAAHVLAVSGDDETCEVLMSNGNTYQITEKSAKRLHSYLHSKAVLTS